MEKVEIFKDIPGYEGRYQVSNFGNVKSIRRFVHNRYTDEKFLKKCTDTCGYNVIGLWRNNKGKLIKIHRLVYCTFNSIDINTSLCICHKDDIKTNNRLENLWIGTTQENTQDCKIKGRTCRGEKNIKCKLKEHEVKQIKILLKNNPKKLDKEKIALAFGISYSTIQHLYYGRTWKHV